MVCKRLKIDTLVLVFSLISRGWNELGKVDTSELPQNPSSFNHSWGDHASGLPTFLQFRRCQVSAQRKLALAISNSNDNILLYPVLTRVYAAAIE
jgi:hypothetical protein